LETQNLNFICSKIYWKWHRFLDYLVTKQTNNLKWNIYRNYSQISWPAYKSNWKKTCQNMSKKMFLRMWSFCMTHGAKHPQNMLAGIFYERRICRIYNILSKFWPTFLDLNASNVLLNHLLNVHWITKNSVKYQVQCLSPLQQEPIL